MHATHFNPAGGGRMLLPKLGNEIQFHGVPIPKNKINMNVVKAKWPAWNTEALVTLTVANLIK
jgi:hypothetical protein